MSTPKTPNRVGNSRRHIQCLRRDGTKEIALQVIKLLLQEVCVGRCDVVGDGQQESWCQRYFDVAGEDQGTAAGGEKRAAGAALWFSASKVLQRRAAAVPGV